MTPLDRYLLTVLIGLSVINMAMIGYLVAVVDGAGM